MTKTRAIREYMRIYKNFKKRLEMVSEYKARQWILLYKQGVPANEIANRWGCNSTQVVNVLKGANVYDGENHKSW